jgi:CheY-like chemotaxis protein
MQVNDTGSGIAPTLLPYVFDLFAQGERSPDRAQGGLGLGLALVKELTSLHGGEITASSKGPGEGSTFTLVLPLIATPPTGAAFQEPQVRELGDARKVVIVDDNADAAVSLSALLQSDGHDVSVLGDAGSALALKNREHIDAFVLDIGLPEMDGHELARRLRSDPATANALLIALTGYGEAHDRVRSEAAGFDHHLVKPVDMTQLRSLLRGATGK